MKDTNTEPRGLIKPKHIPTHSDLWAALPWVLVAVFGYKALRRSR